MMRAVVCSLGLVFFFSSRRRHTRCGRDWSSDVCSSDLEAVEPLLLRGIVRREHADRVERIGDACRRLLVGGEGADRAEIGRAAGRGRGESSVVAGSLKKKKKELYTGAESMRKYIVRLAE